MSTWTQLMHQDVVSCALFTFVLMSSWILSLSALLLVAALSVLRHGDHGGRHYRSDDGVAAETEAS